MRILLSAYACEPNRGSEPGVGWEWATRLSRSCDVTVLTRANNRAIIEEILGSQWQPGHPRFIYLDLPSWLRKLKKLGILPVFSYYLLWQLAAISAIRAGAERYDIIHHVTFNGFRFPGAWWHADAPVVLGPLGGGSITAPQFRRCYGPRWITEKFREYSVKLWQWNPWTVASLNRARTVMVVGEDLLRRFLAAGINAHMMLETALPQALEKDPPVVPPETKRDFIWVGNLEPWKAWQIALEAFSLALSRETAVGKLKIIGQGKQEAAARKTAITLGIADRVDFICQQPRDEVWKLMASARALIFSSVRDTSGNVVIEAMGLRCPIICFQHQGVAMMTDDRCAFRIKPSDWRASVEGFAAAITSLARDNSLVESMGDAGRARAMTEFTWDAKVAEMLGIYHNAHIR